MSRKRTAESHQNGKTLSAVRTLYTPSSHSERSTTVRYPETRPSVTLFSTTMFCQVGTLVFLLVPDVKEWQGATVPGAEEVR